MEYDPGFRLYLQTKLSNPHYKPEIAAQVKTHRESLEFHHKHVPLRLKHGDFSRCGTNRLVTRRIIRGERRIQL